MADDFEVTETPEPDAPAQPATPIRDRFLFVDVAALRAKQLRRGALPRLSSEAENARPDAPIKPERIAMEEVRRGLVQYDVPAPKPVAPDTKS
jgi:DNA-directed RNA polymerase subunit K/omega